jgi:L-threonylcarbamoyladenylate synthase
MELSEALRAGRPVIFPTDTVYGLAASAAREEHAAELYRLKGRPPAQPTALIAGSLDQLFAALPELPATARAIAAELLPGPFTLVLPNPAGRYRWLTGTRAEALGVRVPVLAAAAERALHEVGCITATSANEPGEPDPVTIDDVPARIRRGCAAELDVGPLPGTPSTVLDFSEAEPRVLREGLAPSAAALDRVRRLIS